MTEMLRSLLPVAILIAVLLGAFHLYRKYSTIIVIEETDHSMDPGEYPAKHYTCDTSAAKAGDLHLGDVVAYWLPETPGQYKVARVVALEGQTIAADGKTLTVDDNATALRLERTDWRFPAVRVPRGCLFLMADTYADACDSARLGAVPFLNVIGKLRN